MHEASRLQGSGVDLKIRLRVQCALELIRNQQILEGENMKLIVLLYSIQMNELGLPSVHMGLRGRRAWTGVRKRTGPLPCRTCVWVRSTVSLCPSHQIWRYSPLEADASHLGGFLGAFCGMRSGEMDLCVRCDVDGDTISFLSARQRSQRFTQYSVVRCSAIQCSADQCCALQYSAMQYSEVRYSAVQCHVVHRSTRELNAPIIVSSS